MMHDIAGATISKSINRISGTSLAGFLAVGVHWIASKAGEQYEPFIVGISVFLLGKLFSFFFIIYLCNYIYIYT